MRSDDVSRRLQVVLVLVGLLVIAWPAAAEPESKKDPGKRTSSRSTAPRFPRSSRRKIVPPSACYKAGTDKEDILLDFVDTGFQWPQPDGPESAVTITYSYSNLLDGQVRGITPAQARAAVEEALAVWATVAPLNFVEVEDSGPDPAEDDASYDADGRPQIRIGHHELDGASGGVLAHAFLPFSATDGIAGDIHVDPDEDWSIAAGGYFLEMILHELGHTLGLDHEEVEDAIMNSVIVGRFDRLGAGELLDDDIAGIRALYGQGIGSVTPLEEDPDEPDEPQPPEDEPGDPEPEPDPAGVTAEMDGETLVISGDSEDSSVLLWSFFWVTIVAGMDDTSVNGEAWDYFGGGPPSTVRCDLGDGADLLWLFRFRGEQLDCSLGSGEDALFVLLSSVDQLVADGGEGEDLLLRLLARVGSITDQSFESVYGL